MAKDRYEISLWEDYIEPSSIQDGIEVPEHYEERKIAVIGSDSMTALCRAIEPRLVENVNGVNTFTFRVFYTYRDEEGKLVQNPFLSLLVNERKIKVFWKEKWYDLIIKNCQEDSEGKSITYTCTDLYVNELSKNGFDLEFDADLNNNQGTAAELAEKVLDGTDWIVDAESDNIQQLKDEPVYAVKLKRSLSSSAPDSTLNETKNLYANVPSGANILVYYGQIQNIVSSGENSGIEDIQFAYASSYDRDTNSQLVINADCYRVSNCDWAYNSSSEIVTLQKDSKVFAEINCKGGVSDDYRASRLVRSQLSVFDPLTERYCKVFTATASSSDHTIDSGDVIYSYNSTEYKTPDYVGNLVANSKDFINTNGWSSTESDQIFLLGTYPPFNQDLISEYTSKVYMRIGAGGADNAIKAAVGNYATDGFAQGEAYIFRYKALRGNKKQTKPASDEDALYITENNDDIVISKQVEYGPYKITPSIIDSNNVSYFTIDTTYGENGIFRTDDHWIERRLVCTKTVTRADIYNENIHLNINIYRGKRPEGSEEQYTEYTNTAIWVQEIELFKEVFGSENNEIARINPGELNKISISQTYYCYYNHTKSTDLTNKEDIKPLYRGVGDWERPDYIKPNYNENYEKIRSISVKQSNRFNILQTIAETFQCWIKFEIDHDINGKTIYDFGIPRKKVKIVKEIGEEVGAGFVYGIDLKSIQRTIQSDQIVTKTIVLANSNEFAQDGFCTIARSAENYPRTNFILNFDYYVTQGLLSSSQLNKDLYLSTDGLGYYYNLNRYNKEYNDSVEKGSKREIELIKQQSLLKTYEAAMAAASEAIVEETEQLVRLAGAASESDAADFITNNQDNIEVKTRLQSLQTYRSTYDAYSAKVEDLRTVTNTLKQEVESIKENQKTLRNNINDLNLKFYKKYSRFIQEGTWTSQDYVDDTLYYLDALSVGYTSSRPQISYNIAVLRLSHLEDFKNKVFHLGDISFVEDPEFFGYTYIDDIKTPYKEKVLVSEISSYFDSPEQDTITVQNYKTQFEDLFQRITSATQSLQYNSGEYARAANAVQSNGTINPKTMQDTLAYNEQLVYSAQNDAVTIDATGITVTDQVHSERKTKVTSGGVILSDDGGITWRSAISAKGLNTQELTAGEINVESITVLDGQHSTFRWDSTGINAYDREEYDDDRYRINPNKFVRFDYNGIYGWYSEDPVPSTPSDIIAQAPFGMTWDGFFMKNQEGDHYLEISNKEDLRVVYTGGYSDVDLIKIGKLDEDNYGIRFKDITGRTTLRTDNAGLLWLDNKLSISTSTDSSYNVELGRLDEYKVVNNKQVHEVMRAGVVGDSEKQFIVYEDGSIKATYGQIGNLSIEAVEQSAYKVEIMASPGTVFKNGQGPIELTAVLISGNTPIAPSSCSYQWYAGSSAIAGATNQVLVLSSAATDVQLYSCEVTYPKE